MASAAGWAKSPLPRFVATWMLASLPGNSRPSSARKASQLAGSLGEDHRSRARNRPPRAEEARTRLSPSCPPGKPHIDRPDTHLNRAQKGVVEDVLKLCRTVFKGVQETRRHQAKQRRFPSFAAPPNGMATRSRASPRPPALRGSSARLASNPGPCKGSCTLAQSCHSTATAFLFCG